MWRVLFLGAVSEASSHRLTISDQGDLHVESEITTNVLYAVNRDGSTKWSSITCRDILLCDISHIEGSSNTVFLAEHTSNGIPGDSESHSIFALDGADGSTKWKFQLGENRSIRAADLMLAPDGTVFAATHCDSGPWVSSTSNTTIAAVDADGGLRWTQTFPGGWGPESDGFHSFGADGTFLFQGGGFVNALQPDTGTLKWSVAVNQCGHGAPVAALAEDRIFLLQPEQNCSQWVLSSLRIEDGDSLWRLPFPDVSGDNQMSMEFGSKGEIYVNNVNLYDGPCSFQAIDFDGNVLRNLPCLNLTSGQWLWSQRAHYEDLFFVLTSTEGGADGALLAQSGTDGALLWNVTDPDWGFQNSKPFVCSDGTVFMLTDGEVGEAEVIAIRNGSVAWRVLAGHDDLVCQDGITHILSKKEVIAVGVDGAELWRYELHEPDAQFV